MFNIAKYMQKINFQNLPNKTTPLNAENLNQIQTNVENALKSEAVIQLPYNDTSGSDWKEMLRNKIDYILNNTTQNNITCMFSGGWSGHNYGFSIAHITNDRKIVEILWISSNTPDGMLYAKKTNSTYVYKVYNDNSVTEGTATLNSTYFSSGTCRWIKTGNIVTVTVMDAITSTACSTNNTVLVTGLPKAKRWEVFMLQRYNTNASLRVGISGTNIVLCYDSMTAECQQWYGQFTYITTD